MNTISENGSCYKEVTTCCLRVWAESIVFNLLKPQRKNRHTNEYWA